ncbi:hypothetical protein [Halapricum hydrolyticum]|uniref:Uncharacterized protein n=1 Tax=Halapricum hydrolyticum TaxID=2979991 RepID=A0AAE3LIN3_9EURY|nr:hypothetical protein [Halapricum hydrolyticum]MCU4718404.1 hypothetical protein [Halapricum hydrolyticum]MCU4726483.1 hypothetical protein [Halapricum hydrolyticum]
MTVDRATCPHCESSISGDELEKLEVSSDRIAPMGAGKRSDTLYVCPSCNTILG